MSLVILSIVSATPSPGKPGEEDGREQLFWNHLRSVGPHQNGLAVSSSPVITSAVSPPQPSPPAAAGTASRRLVCPRWGVWPASPARPPPNSRPAPVSRPHLANGSPAPGAEPPALQFPCPSPRAAPGQVPCALCPSHGPPSTGPPRTWCFPGQRITRVPGPAASFHTHQKNPLSLYRPQAPPCPLFLFPAVSDLPSGALPLLSALGLAPSSPRPPVLPCPSLCVSARNVASSVGCL